MFHAFYVFYLNSKRWKPLEKTHTNFMHYLAKKIEKKWAAEAENVVRRLHIRCNLLRQIFFIVCCFSTISRCDKIFMRLKKTFQFMVGREKRNLCGCEKKTLWIFNSISILLQKSLAKSTLKYIDWNFLIDSQKSYCLKNCM